MVGGECGGLTVKKAVICLYLQTHFINACLPNQPTENTWFRLMLLVLKSAISLERERTDTVIVHGWMTFMHFGVNAISYNWRKRQQAKKSRAERFKAGVMQSVRLLDCCICNETAFSPVGSD